VEPGHGPQTPRDRRSDGRGRGPRRSGPVDKAGEGSNLVPRTAAAFPHGDADERRQRAELDELRFVLLKAQTELPLVNVSPPPIALH